MIINDLLQKKNMTRYRLAKDSGIPYTTISDICTGKAQLEKCTAETVFRIARVLDVTVEELMKASLDKRPDFELFKSYTCHRLKELGDIDFIIDVLESGQIRKYQEKQWDRECLYLLAMLDYVSRENAVPICNDFDDLRRLKFERPIYPASILAIARVTKDDNILKESIEESIPEFIRFNIVEAEVRDVV